MYLWKLKKSLLLTNTSWLTTSTVAGRNVFLGRNKLKKICTISKRREAEKQRLAEEAEKQRLAEEAEKQRGKHSKLETFWSKNALDSFS